jgi:cytochrome c5
MASWSLLLAAGSVLIFAPAAGQQQAEKLAEGIGADLVQTKCTLCHDIGNITRVRQSREEWEDTLKVMIRRGAPISPEEETVILEYLTRHYGK